MPLRTIKNETTETLILEWALHVKNYHLSVDKSRSVSCQICSLACPKEAITMTKRQKLQRACEHAFSQGKKGNQLNVVEMTSELTESVLLDRASDVVN